MLQILEKLISARSVSPSDDGLIQHIANLLTAHNFTCHIKEFGTGEESTKNLYATFGTKGKNLCFAGHIDVVPPGDLASWKYDPFKMTIEDEKIYGRGAVDMKGAISAMLKSAIVWAEAREERISLLITSDEEASGKYGTKMMLEWMESQGIKIDFAIVGEPTCDKIFGDTIKIGRRGSINFSLKIIGKQGHVAYPEKAINPNSIMVSVLDKLLKHKIDDGNEFFGPSNLEIVSIDTGNNVSNLIPESSSAKFNIRYSSIHEAEEIIAKIKDIISSITEDFELESNISGRAFLSSKTDFAENFKKNILQHTGAEASFSTSGGTSDARFIKDYCPLLEFGLLNTTAHQVDEYTEISHLQTLYKVYYDAINSFHSPNSMEYKPWLRRTS